MELLVTLIVALAISAVGFIKYVYFFSVGYGLSIAGIGTLLLFLFRETPSGIAAVMCALLILYGLRLGGYLLFRELKSAPYRKLLKGEVKTEVPFIAKCCIWLSCSVLYVCQCAPVLFRMRGGEGLDAASALGAALMAAGILLEAMADLQKSRAKKSAPHSFVRTGLYRFVRCPNYFGELLLWAGVFISGLSVYRGALEWTLSILGFVGIAYVMFSGARRLELRQDKNYGGDPAYREYVQTTPILIPFVPLYSVKKYKWLVA